MAIAAQRREQEEVPIQLSAMIDITFLLLIFFMVTTKITEEKKKLDINLPIAPDGIVPDELGERDIINLDGEGNYYIGDNAVTKEELKAHLKKRFINAPPLKIYLRADANSPAKRIKEFMKMAAEVGAVEVIFASYKKPQ